LVDFVKACVAERWTPAPDKLLCAMNVDGTWDMPVERATCNEEAVVALACARHADGGTDYMRMLAHIDAFMAPGTAAAYAEAGHPYRCGVLLSGAPHTYKTRAAFLVASKYRMPYFAITLNDGGLDDARLVALVTQVPERSVIIIDEADRLLHEVSQSANRHVTYGGVLLALGGPIPMAPGCIVFVVANDVEPWRHVRVGGDGTPFLEALYREGRLNHVHLTGRHVAPVQAGMRGEIGEAPVDPADLAARN
jgi:hypothetical protein